MTSSTRANPYVGPRAFRTGETLYGRDREASDVLDLLLAERIVLLHSPSGAGKSSLIHAALIPRLRNERFLVLPVIRVNQALPSALAASSPNRYVYSTLFSLDSERPEAKRLSPERLAALSISDYLQDRSGADGEQASVMLIFDQFEEALVLDPTDREAKSAFFAQIGAALRDRSRWALFAIREDYLAALEPYVRPIPTRLSNTFRLNLLGPDAARQAIQRPARQAEVDFTDAAAIQLVDNLRLTRVPQPDGTIKDQPGPFVEPVQLQVVCRRMWDFLPEGAQQITRDDVESVGDVNSALAGYYSDRVAEVARETGVQERAIRDWVQERLITKQGLRGQVLREHRESGGLDNRAIELLEDAHLIRAEKRSGLTWYELAHDRLIVPVTENNAAWIEAHLSPLQRQAALWAKENYPEHLLMRGKELIDAEQWAAKHGEELTPDERDFLRESRKARTAVVRQQRTNRLIAALAVVALAFGVVAWMFYGVSQEQTRQARAAGEIAVTSQAKAEALASELAFAVATAQAAREDAEALRNEARQREIAEFSRKLAAAASGDVSPDLALLLSLQAGILSDTVEARASLLNGLIRTARIHWIANSGSSSPNSVAFNPDGKTLAVAANDGSVSLWDSVSGNLIRSWYPDFDTVWDVAFSPDGKALVTRGYGGIRVSRVDTDTSTLLSASDTLDPGKGLAVSPDGQTLAASAFGSIYLWDLASGEQLESPLTFSETLPVSQLAVSPDDQTLAAGYADGRVVIWSVPSRQPLDTALEGHNAPITLIKFIQDDQQPPALATADSTGVVILWDVNSGEKLAEYQTAQQNSGSDLSDDLSKVAFGRDDGSVVLWDLTRQAGETFKGHTSRVAGLAFSPEGDTLVSIGDDGKLIAWRVSGDALSGKPIEAGGPLVGVAFSAADGGETLVAGAPEQIAIWDVASRQPIGKPLTATVETVTPVAPSSVAFSPDGQTLVSGGSDGALVIWDTESHEPRESLQGEPSAINSVAVSPDGTVWAAAQDVVVRLWNTSSGQSITLTGQLGITVVSVAFSPDGEILAAGNSTGSITLWNVTSGREIGEPLTGHTGLVDSLAFSPDGNILAAGDDSGSIVLWDVATRQAIGEPLAGHTSYVLSVAFSPDGSTLASGGNDGTIRLWDASSGAPVGDPLDSTTIPVNSVAFSPDGATLASGSTDSSVRLWNVASGQPIGDPLAGHTDSVRSVAFSPDGRFLASASGDSSILLWDMATNQVVEPPLRREVVKDIPHVISRIAVSPDGKTLASGGQSGEVILWNLSQRRIITAPLTGHAGSVNGLAISPDGSLLASSGTDGNVYVWDTESGQMHGQLPAGEFQIASAIVFGPQDQTLIAGYDDGSVGLWTNVLSAEPLNEPFKDRHLERVAALAVSLDGMLVASGSVDGIIIVWDYLSREPIRSIDAGLEAVASLTFGPDGAALASGLANGAVVVWDVATGQRIAALTRHSATVTGVAFSPDGKTLATGSEDATILLWNVDLQVWKTRACRLAGRNLTWAEWDQFLRGVDYQATCPDNPVDYYDVAGGYLERAGQHALFEDTEEAKAALEEAAEWGVQTDDFSTVSEVCKFGLLNGFDETVEDACQRAVEIGAQTEDVFALYELCQIGLQEQRAGLVAQACLPMVEISSRSEDFYQLYSVCDLGSLYELDISETCQRAVEIGSRSDDFDQIYSVCELGGLYGLDAAGACQRAAEQTSDPQTLAEIYALAGETERAESAYRQALQEIQESDDASALNSLCWQGSVNGFAAIVLPACERAVELAESSGDTYSVTAYRDSRGLARAMTGNVEGAIEDFQFFIDAMATTDDFDPETEARYTREREDIIAALREGRDPFTEELLRALREE